MAYVSILDRGQYGGVQLGPVLTPTPMSASCTRSDLDGTYGLNTAYLQIFLRSFWLSATTTVIALAIGFPDRALHERCSRALPQHPDLLRHHPVLDQPPGAQLRLDPAVARRRPDQHRAHAPGADRPADHHALHATSRSRSGSPTRSCRSWCCPSTPAWRRSTSAWWRPPSTSTPAHPAAAPGADPRWPGRASSPAASWSSSPAWAPT